MSLYVVASPVYVTRAQRENRGREGKPSFLSYFFFDILIFWIHILNRTSYIEMQMANWCCLRGQDEERDGLLMLLKNEHFC